MMLDCVWASNFAIIMIKRCLEGVTVAGARWLSVVVRDSQADDRCLSSSILVVRVGHFILSSLEPLWASGSVCIAAQPTIADIIIIILPCWEPSWCPE